MSDPNNMRIKSKVEVEISFNQIRDYIYEGAPPFDRFALLVHCIRALTPEDLKDLRDVIPQNMSNVLDSIEQCKEQNKVYKL